MAGNDILIVQFSFYAPEMRPTLEKRDCRKLAQRSERGPSTRLQGKDDALPSVTIRRN
jgi:hypothetical protein